tara:strand:+ start:41 stop:166 length:126 start_codon:yes stop_codon:yes gene_type:complete
MEQSVLLLKDKLEGLSLGCTSMNTLPEAQNTKLNVPFCDAL